MLCSLILLTACDTRPVKPGPEPDVTVPGTATPEEQDLMQQAQQLLEQAEDADSTLERHQLRLRAVKLYIRAGDKLSARRLLDAVASEATGDPAENADINILYASLAIADRNRTEAEQYITLIKPVRRDQQIDYNALKADLDYLDGRYLDSVDRRTQLEQYITDPEQKKINRLRIWAALTAMPDSALDPAGAARPDIAGWMDLARVVRNNQRDIAGLEDKLLDWGTRYPQHPANDGFLTELVDIYHQDSGDRRHIAIILPLQGDLATVSATIRNGFLSAFYSNRSGQPPEIRFYDSSDEDTGFNDIYARAVQAGATNVIGPLDKRKVNELLAMETLEVPVLSLNYADNAVPAGADTDTYNPGATAKPAASNLFQFGLSPEDEARQVAELAIQRKQTRAAVFYPDSDWGRRVKNAFNYHYRKLGGNVQTETDYVTDTSDYRRPIRQLLNLDKSDIRRQRIENIISERTQNEPYRRQDIDMIFLAATSRSARSIMPAFKFHRAGDLPVYSTSHVYTGIVDRDQDRDLDGLMFCDLPWILEQNTGLTEVFKRNWPQQQAYTRLFALGVDAYHLVYNMDYMKNFGDASYPGLTGEISLTDNNRFSRKLLWAQFVRGRPVGFTPEPPAELPSEPKQIQSQAAGKI